MNRDFSLFYKYVAPSIIGMIIGGSFAIVDTIFIGQYGGKNSLAAVAVTWPGIILLQAFGNLIGAGGAVLISQYNGARELDKVNKIFANTVFLCIWGSLLLTILTFPILEGVLSALGSTPELMPISLKYTQIWTAGLILSVFMTLCLEIIRNDGHPVLSMMLMVIGLLCNVFLDWFCVFYLNMGAAGAAVATVISQVGSCILGILYFVSPLTGLRLTKNIFAPALKEIKEIIVTGLPVFGNMLSIIAMLYMHNAQSLRYGGVDGLAAYTVISTLEALGSMLMTGVAAGIQPLTAQMYGAGKFKRQNRFGNMGYTLAFVLGVILMLFSFAMHKIMPGWMGLSEGSVRQLAMTGIVLSAPAFLLLGVIRVATFYYQSTGNIGKSSWLIYGDSFIALPLCIYILPCFWGMNGVWLAMPVSRILLLGLLLYFWFGIKRK